MKIELDIKDDKVAFFMELLKNFPFVKRATIKKSHPKTSEDEEPSTNDILAGIQDALTEMKLHSEDKVKLKTDQQFLDEF